MQNLRPAAEDERIIIFMKLLLAEDTKDLNRALSAVLIHEHYDVDSVFDGEEASAYLRSGSYDAIILDIMMPKKDGLEVLRELRKDGIETPVLLLTAKAEIDDRVTGLDAGADDYLTKPFAIKELLARVRSILRRGGSTETILHAGDISLDAETMELSAANSVRLSVKEFELLQLLLRNTDRELGTEHLLAHVWENEPETKADTVRLYISYLKAKLVSVGSEYTISGSDDENYRFTKGLPA